MALAVEPESVTLSGASSAVFRASRDGTPADADWRIVPSKGKIDGGVYESPRWVFTSRPVRVLATDTATSEVAVAVVHLSASHTWIVAIGIYLPLAAAIAVAGLLYASTLDGSTNALLRAHEISLSAGVLGATLHGLNSIVNYVGNRQFLSSWAPFYLARPIVGGILALLVYWSISGALIPIDLPDEGEGLQRLYAIAAISGLVGLFGDVTIEKLRDVLQALFSGRGDERGDKLTRAEAVTLTLARVVPDSIPSDGSVTKIELEGTGFTRESKVTIGGEDRVTGFESATKLTVELLPKDYAQPAELTLAVSNPDGSSAEMEAKVS